MEQGERKTYLDALRVLACLFVFYNHVAGQSMRLFSGVGGAAALTLFYVSKSAIPLFLMISGAVLLWRVEPYARTLRRIGRILLALVLISLFYYGMECAWQRAPFVLSDFWDRLYHYRLSNSLWYLYAYLGLLIMLPILQRMTAAFQKNEYLYFAFWTLLFNGGMPVLQSIAPLFIYDDSFYLSIFTGVIGMAVLGRGVDAHMRFTKLRTAVAILLPVCLAAGMTALTMHNPLLFNAFDNAFLLPAMATAVCLFYLARLADERHALSVRMRACVSHAARLVFCAYLFADFAIERLAFVREALVPVLRVNGAGAAYVALVFLVCMLAAELLTRIPGIKRLL